MRRKGSLNPWSVVARYARTRWSCRCTQAEEHPDEQVESAIEDQLQPRIVDDAAAGMKRLPNTASVPLVQLLPVANDVAE